MPVADAILEVIFQKLPKAAHRERADNRFGFILLQTLVTIVLCYELLFSGDAVLPSDYQQPLVAVLMLINAVLMFLPVRVLEADWFTGALVMGDTGLTTAIIYLSGNASSDLYITYFLIILIAAFSTSLNQLIAVRKPPPPDPDSPDHGHFLRGVCRGDPQGA
jgi:membrane-associated HD superfamily phosphohydrolase